MGNVFDDILEFSNLSVNEDFVLCEDEPFELVHVKKPISVAGNNAMCRTSGNYVKIADDAKVKRFIGD